MEPSYAPTPRPSASAGCFRTGWAGVLSNVLIFLLVFGLSASVETEAVRSKITSKWQGLLMGLGSQFVVLPFIGCASARALLLLAPLHPPPHTLLARRAGTPRPWPVQGNWERPKDGLSHRPTPLCERNLQRPVTKGICDRHRVVDVVSE